MKTTRYAVGVDISTQTVTAVLVGVVESDGAVADLILNEQWHACRPYAGDDQRRSPAAWVALVRDCIAELRSRAPETKNAMGLGVSTTFPGTLAVDKSGGVDPRLVSFYDNTDDAGICDGDFEEALARAESDTLNRMWPGNMAIGLIHLVKDRGLRLDQLAAIVPPNTAFAHGLLRAAGVGVDPKALFSDFTQTVIGGLCDARTAAPLPGGVRDLLTRALPGIDLATLELLLPQAAPAWTNVLTNDARNAVRSLLGLPALEAVSLGAGDSALGTLALRPESDGILNVRGSSDTPVLIVDSPQARTTAREVLLHYPMVTSPSMSQSTWCAAAPILRSGRVWDWVRRLRYPDATPEADAALEQLALEALLHRSRHHSDQLTFRTALGGERAPDWDSHATGSVTGLLESHSIGDIALAALEGMSQALRGCIELLESRYGISTTQLLLAGGPTRNALWNWVTQQITGKQTRATTFSEASVLGAGLLGYATSYDASENRAAVARRLDQVSLLCADHALIRPTPVLPPDPRPAAKG